METNSPQKELFEFEAPKKMPRPGFGRFLQQADWGIVLTPEKIVFLAIGIVMLMVIFFALGVEKGKSMAAKVVAPTTTVAATARPEAPQAQAKAAVTPVKVAAAPVAQIKTMTASTNITPKDKQLDKPYIIVAATFSRQDTATKEVSSLKAAGLDAFVYCSEPYYLACVGSFANKDSAQKILSRVRQMHRDAYVRLK